jgi:precorrin-2 methylase
MPYYVYKISKRDDLELLRHLELLQVCDAFKAAKAEARRLREEQSQNGLIYKVIFAGNQLEAEERLLEKREKPVLMEHER